MSRDAILGRIRAARERREARAAEPSHEQPGSFGAWRPHPAPEPLDGFAAMFETAGGTVVAVPDEAAAVAWLRNFAAEFESYATGTGVEALVGSLELDAAPVDRPADAALGISVARGAVAETGSLLMDARDGRRAQLLPPVHVVLVDARTVHGTLRDALVTLGSDLPSAVGLHSGPSKSADIGQMMVRGVHGPGRVVALVIGWRGR